MPPFKTTALPPVGATFTVREVAAQAGCTIRTVRHYIREKVVPAPEFRSSKTRYDRAFLVRLRAGMTLRRRGLHVRGVREALDATAPEEMVRLAGYEVPAEAAEGLAASVAAMARAPAKEGAAGGTRAPGSAGGPQASSGDGTADFRGGRRGLSALGGGEEDGGAVRTPLPGGAVAGVRSLPAGFLGRHRPGASAPHERWDSFELCPGVKLVVRAEADPEAFRVVQEVLALFGPAG